MSKPSNNTNYILPRLQDYKGDVTRKWVITFYVANDKGNLIRKRVTAFNNSFVKRERYKAAQEAMKSITALLKEGYTVASTNEVDKNEGLLDLDKVTVVEALLWAKEMKFKTKKLSTTSTSTYTSHLNSFIQWLIDRGEDDLKLKNVKKKLMYDFFDQLISVHKLSDKTHNNYMIDLAALFGMIVKRHDGYINPMVGMEKKSYVLPRTNKAFTKKQLENIRAEILRQGEAQLYLFCHFIYYCFIRPSELLRLKVKNIHPEMVELSGAQNTKIQYTNFREIPDALNEIIDQYGVRNRHPDEYLFMNAFTLGKKKVGINFFQKKFSPIIKKLGMDPEFYGTYSFKHTGNVRMFEIYKDPRKNMIQNGHTNLETTLIYLRDLGVNINQDLKDFR